MDEIKYLIDIFKQYGFWGFFFMALLQLQFRCLQKKTLVISFNPFPIIRRHSGMQGLCRWHVFQQSRCVDPVHQLADLL